MPLRGERINGLCAFCHNPRKHKKDCEVRLYGKDPSLQAAKITGEPLKVLDAELPLGTRIDGKCAHCSRGRNHHPDCPAQGFLPPAKPSPPSRPLEVLDASLPLGTRIDRRCAHCGWGRNHHPDCAAKDHEKPDDELQPLDSSLPLGARVNRRCAHCGRGRGHHPECAANAPERVSPATAPSPLPLIASFGPDVGPSEIDRERFAGQRICYDGASGEVLGHGATMDDCVASLPTSGLETRSLVFDKLPSTHPAPIYIPPPELEGAA